MPVFAGTTSDKLTVYEFEKEWMAYTAVANYSVEEALKEIDTNILLSYLLTHFPTFQLGEILLLKTSGHTGDTHRAVLASLKQVR